MHEILQVLRILTLVRFTDPIAVFNRLALSEAIYVLEYQLLKPENWPSAELQEPFRLAVSLYINRVLREMPPLNTEDLTARFLTALRSSLRTGQSGVLEHQDLGIMLWILCISQIFIPDFDEKRHLLQAMVQICKQLNLLQEEDFRRYLDNVGSAIQAFDRECRAMWVEIEENIRR